MIYKKPVSVLVVIHTIALEVLLLERARHPGFWQSVTGSQEDAEPLLETARREVCEETGIAAAQNDFIDWQMSNRYEIFAEWRHRYAPGITHNTEHVFSLCLPRKSTVTIAPDEHLSYRWLPWREAADACFSWTNRDAILELPRRLGGCVAHQLGSILSAVRQAAGGDPGFHHGSLATDIEKNPHGRS